MKWFGAEAGSLGPVGVKNMRILADLALEGRRNMIAGANKDDYHLRHVTPGEDFQAEYTTCARWRRATRAWSAAGRCTLSKTIEIGHIFKLGYRYSESMGLRVLNAEGQEVTPIMGSYGIGIERILSSAVELYARRGRHGAAGIHRAVRCGGHAGQHRRCRAAQAAEEIYESCLAAGLDALLDDRDERPGVKFKDADLIGIPYRITVGKKLAKGLVEVVERRGKKTADVEVGNAVRCVAERVERDLRNER